MKNRAGLMMGKKKSACIGSVCFDSKSLTSAAPAKPATAKPAPTVRGETLLLGGGGVGTIAAFPAICAEEKRMKREVQRRCDWLSKRRGALGRQSALRCPGNSHSKVEGGGTRTCAVRLAGFPEGRSFEAGVLVRGCMVFVTRLRRRVVELKRVGCQPSVFNITLRRSDHLAPSFA